jgi:AbrB family looped-hinge helix DNA binding protein
MILSLCRPPSGGKIFLPVTGGVKMLNGRSIRVSPKGQLVIPTDIRREMGLQGGGEMAAYLVGGRYLIMEVPQPSELDLAIPRLEALVADPKVPLKSLTGELRKLNQLLRAEVREMERKDRKQSGPEGR